MVSSAHEEESILDLDDELKRRAILVELEMLLSAGFTDEQARYEMGVSYSDYRKAKEALYSERTADIKRSSAHDIFIDYAYGQHSILKGIDALMEKMDDSKQYSAAVGALRLASDVRERIIRVGQDLGVLSKRPEEKRHFVISGSLEEMRAVVAKQVKEIDAMMKDSTAKGILDMDPGSLYRDTPAVEAPSTTGRARAHSGRRVLKEGPKVSS